MGSRGTILVVDDEPGILEVLDETLSPYYDIMTAANGKEALGLLEKKHPDIIISDVSMPVMDGLELMTSLRRMDLSVKIPLLFLSARGQIADVEKGLQMGAYGYVVKPFLPTQLTLKVDEMFEKLATRRKMKQTQ